MQNELKISATEYTPEIDFNANTGSFIIKGKSMPEDVGGFFNPIFEWVREYVNNAASKTELKIFFDYYNSSTARRITELIFDLEQLAEKGKDVKVIWCYKSGDLIMKENGEEIKGVIDIPFELMED